MWRSVYGETLMLTSRRSREDFSGLPTDIAPHTVQLIAQLEWISEGANCNRFPCRNFALGLDNRLGRFRGARLELQLVL